MCGGTVCSRQGSEPEPLFRSPRRLCLLIALMAATYDVNIAPALRQQLRFVDHLGHKVVANLQSFEGGPGREDVPVAQLLGRVQTSECFQDFSVGLVGEVNCVEVAHSKYY